MNEDPNKDETLIPVQSSGIRVTPTWRRRSRPT
jgi:hypothetical protein